MVYPALLPLMGTPRLPVVEWTDVPADLNGLVPFTERRNLVSACVCHHISNAVYEILIQWHWKGRDKVHCRTGLGGSSFNLSTRWSEWSKSCPRPLYRRQRNPAPIVEEAGAHWHSLNVNNIFFQWCQLIHTRTHSAWPKAFKDAKKIFKKRGNF